jgi:hypothetical protein
MEEPTPTSKLAFAAEDAQAATAAAATTGDGAHVVAGDQQQQWVGWEGYGEQAANGCYPQDQAGQQWQPDQQQQYSLSGWQLQDRQYVQQQYDPNQTQYGQYGEYAPQYQHDQQQQYGMSDWQQQQEGVVADDQAAMAPEDWAAHAGAVRGATWGSPDTEMLESGAPEAKDTLEQPQQGAYSAAAADEVSGAWGAEDAASDLQLGVVSVAADPAAALAAAAAAHRPSAADELHAPEVIAAARAARISTSSVGLESQPSTGRAVSRIVSSALEKIKQEHAAVPEEADQEAAPAAGLCGWEGGEADADGWESGSQVQEQAEGTDCIAGRTGCV